MTDDAEERGQSGPERTKRVPIEVRFRDLDAMGHVNNAVFATYLEIARTHLWMAFAGGDFAFILARLEIDFRRPVALGEDLEVEIGFGALGRSSFDLVYRVRKVASGELAAEARSVQVSFDYAAGKTTPLSDELKAKIRAFEG